MTSIEWLSHLIAFDTTSRHSNLKLIDFIEIWLKKQHITSHLTYDAKKEKANLFATLPAQNGSVNGGILLSGHTDVVPVDGQHWDTNPFEATIIDDKVYGRGACDMKGFLAVMLALIPQFQLSTRKFPIHFAFSYDEEVGCHGASVLISDLQQRGIKPSTCIVGEPTQMHPVVAHKGISVFRCRIQGIAAHSSLTPEGCNAIEYAAKLISYIRALADQFHQQGPFDLHFDVPFTSISTNLIQGGIASNIIPDTCEFTYEFRHLPQIKPSEIQNKIEKFVQEELLPTMQREHHTAHIKIEKVGAVPSFESSETAAITKLIRKITEEKKIFKVAYATEAGLFQAADIPTIVCGPGSIEQAHRANEFVTIDQLSQCEIFLQRVMDGFIG